MMSNNTYFNPSPLSNATTLAKDEELQKFENSFFPAGGAPQLANIPQAPPAPRNINNVRSNPLNLKTRNWGPKLENGYGGLNRSLYDRPNVFDWDNKPILGERSHLTNNNNNVLSSSFPSSSSSTSTTSTSRSVVDNIPSAIAAPLYRDVHNHRIHGRGLRLHNWGYPTAEGWSGMNRELYNAGMRLERDVLLNELRYKYGPRPNFQQEERSIATEINLVETVPTTTLIETGPTKVLATTVPVPMLNPPINDGRRYAKLYKRNTNALASEKGLTKLVKRRGTRRDHLVQPTTAAPLTSIATAVPYAGGSVIQPATLVSETRSVLPATGIAPYTAVAPMTTFAPTPVVSKAEMKREKRAMRDQQKFAKKEQRAARKAYKKNGVAAPIISGPVLTAAPMSTLAPLIFTAPVQSEVLPGPVLQTAAVPATFVGSPALQNATFVGETRSVLPQEATLIAPMTTATTTQVLTPVGVSAQPLDHAHVLAGQLGNAPVKRPRRARKATKGTEQPMYSNIISSTPAPVTTTTIIGAPITSATTSYTSSSIVNDGTTIVQPATLVSETRNIIVDPLVQQQGMIKQDYNTAPAISPLAMGNPIM